MYIRGVLLQLIAFYLLYKCNIITNRFSEMIKLNLSFKDHIKSYILKNNLFKYNHNSKYTIDQILDVIEYILITGSSWRSLDLPIFNGINIKWQSMYHHFI